MKTTIMVLGMLLLAACQPDPYAVCLDVCAEQNDCRDEGAPPKDCMTYCDVTAPALAESRERKRQEVAAAGCLEEQEHEWACDDAVFCEPGEGLRFPDECEIVGGLRGDALRRCLERARP